MLAASLSSPASFDGVQATFAGFFPKLILWVLLSALFYHLFAGVRHLLMDIGIGEDLVIARRTSFAALILGAVFSLLVGVWLW
jgi:succinate dehydrogenase / fumarate reductase cytochrome b subunit